MDNLKKIQKFAEKEKEKEIKKEEEREKLKSETGERDGCNMRAR
jgi:hypothetical protein